MRPALELTRGPGTIWRIGYRPDPWRWTDWRHATDNGRFAGRWDDQLAEFRTIYMGESLEACLLEVLAHFRPDPALDAELDDIDDPDGLREAFPDSPAGTIGRHWLDDRIAGTAELLGTYCLVTHSRSLAAIRRTFPFRRYGLTPRTVDASTLKDAGERDLTRSIARWLYDLPGTSGVDDTVDGVEFLSRFGDDLRLWAVFERDEDGDGGTSRRIVSPRTVRLESDDPSLRRVLRAHGLRWAD